MSEQVVAYSMVCLYGSLLEFFIRLPTSDYRVIEPHASILRYLGARIFSRARREISGQRSVSRYSPVFILFFSLVLFLFSAPSAHAL